MKPYSYLLYILTLLCNLNLSQAQQLNVYMMPQTSNYPLKISELKDWWAKSDTKLYLTNINCSEQLLESVTVRMIGVFNNREIYRSSIGYPLKTVIGAASYNQLTTTHAAVSIPFVDIQRNINIIADDIKVSENEYGAIIRSNQVPGGLYTICVIFETQLPTAISINGTGSNNYCETFDLISYQAPQLLLPVDNSIINLSGSTLFSWQPIMPTPSKGKTAVYYNVKIVELYEWQSPEQAIRNNPILLQVPAYQANSIDLKSRLVNFKTGIKYVWTIQATNEMLNALDFIENAGYATPFIFTIDNNLFSNINLIYPSNNEVLKNTLVNFTWTNNISTSANNHYFLSVVPVYPGQIVEDAFKVNPPILYKNADFISSLTYLFSNDVFNRELDYAWSIVAKDNNTGSINQSSYNVFKFINPNAENSKDSPNMLTLLEPQGDININGKYLNFVWEDIVDNNYEYIFYLTKLLPNQSVNEAVNNRQIMVEQNVTGKKNYRYNFDINFPEISASYAWWVNKVEKKNIDSVIYAQNAPLMFQFIDPDKENTHPDELNVNLHNECDGNASTRYISTESILSKRIPAKNDTIYAGSFIMKLTNSEGDFSALSGEGTIFIPWLKNTFKAIFEDISIDVNNIMISGQIFINPYEAENIPYLTHNDFIYSEDTSDSTNDINIQKESFYNLIHKQADTVWNYVKNNKKLLGNNNVLSSVPFGINKAFIKNYDINQSPTLIITNIIINPGASPALMTCFLNEPIFDIERKILFVGAIPITMSGIVSEEESPKANSLYPLKSDERFRNFKIDFKYEGNNSFAKINCEGLEFFNFNISVELDSNKKMILKQDTLSQVGFKGILNDCNNWILEAKSPNSNLSMFLDNSENRNPHGLVGKSNIVDVFRGFVAVVADDQSTKISTVEALPYVDTQKDINGKLEFIAKCDPKNNQIKLSWNIDKEKIKYYVLYKTNSDMGLKQIQRFEGNINEYIDSDLHNDILLNKYLLYAYKEDGIHCIISKLTFCSN